MHRLTIDKSGSKSLSIMYHRQSTPPAFQWTDLDFMADVQCSGSSSQSFLPVDYTPESVRTNITTPPKSPSLCEGPRLLPKVRMQDLTTEPAETPMRHRSNSGLSSSAVPMNLNPHVQRSSVFTRSISPANACHLISPVSAPSPCDSLLNTNMCYSISHDGTPSRRPAAAHSRSISTSAIPTHSRNSSSSSIDSAKMMRFSFPTYRTVPQGFPSMAATQAPTAMNHFTSMSLPASCPTPMAFVPPTYQNTPQAPTAMKHLTPMSLPASYPTQTPIVSAARQSTPPRFASTNSPRLFQEIVHEALPTITNNDPNSFSPELVYDPPPPYVAMSRPLQLSQELMYDPGVETQLTSVLNYLTSPNPSPSIIERPHEPPTSQNTHFWFDIRNLRSWCDFNVATITNTPGLLNLLQCPIPVTALATPSRGNPLPETQAQLHQVCRDYFAVKVNATLKIAQGEDHHMALRSLLSTGPTSGDLRPYPEFLSNYNNDTEKTLSADSRQRGRVVGIVRCYQRWNTGMRAESAPQRIKYLAGLAHLHLYMREHGCRYGFIMNEIEVVCVRYGGDKGNPTPYFGFFELSGPIPFATHGRSGSDEQGNSSTQMTAPLALFYLHMLAKAAPLPGQQHWKLDIGGPAATTRHKHLPRDDWMPIVTQAEQRMAKRNRGWVWPEEPLNKRECGKGKRRTTKK